MNILLTAVNAKYIHSNLAVYSLRAYAKQFAGHIGIAEFTINQKPAYILQKIYKKKPDVLCFSCYIWNISIIEEVAEEFHKLHPEVPIWVGGPEVSYEVKAFLEAHPYITGVMMGEGEEIFCNLCDIYVNRRENEESIWERVGGIAYRRKDEICVNPPQPILDMSRIPFAYGDMQDFKNKIIYYESSRGCPFRCSYCLSSVDKQLRFRDMELVKQELAYFVEQKVPLVKFVDRTFNCDSRHAMEIWRYIQEIDNGITNFHFEIAADLMTEEELELIAAFRPGLIQLEIGVQTTNPATIEEIHRRMDLQKVKQVVKRIMKYGNIHQHLDLIAGLPYEDYDTFRHSFDEVYALKPEELQLGFLKVLKGSYMYEHRQEYEVVYSSRPPYEVLKTKWLSYEEVIRIKWAEEMLEVYYNSGQYARAIRLLEGHFNSSFDMFAALGEYYERQGYFQLSHTRNRRAEILLEFVLWKYGKQEDEQWLECFRESLVYDIYARENAKSRPVFADDMQEWKKMSRIYCKNGKLSHLERFWYDTNGEKREIPYYILFDYEKRNPLNHQAAVTRIEEIPE